MMRQKNIFIALIVAFLLAASVAGAVAGHSYAVLKNRKFHRVVIIAPSHYEAFPFSAVYDGDAYVTPLGIIPVDKVFAAALAKQRASIRLSGRGHDRPENSTNMLWKSSFRSY